MKYWNDTMKHKDFAAMILFVTVLICCFVAHGQAQCPLSMNVSSTNVQQLGLADVDVEHFHTSALLFTAHVVNSTGIRQNALLHVTLDVTLADGSLYPQAVDFTFPIDSLRDDTTITNLDFSGNTESFTYDDRAKDRFEEVSLGTGMFPAGSYLFHICLEQPPLCFGVCKDVEFVLQNPSRVELRSPRDGEMTSEFPYFEFYQDANSATLTVAEFQASQSREDAITRKPPMLEVELNGQNSFLYSGGRPLEQGKTYAWQVVSKVPVSGGTDNSIASPIWSFTVSSTSTSTDAILNQLESMFGSRYASIFAQIRSGNLKLTGMYSENNSTLTEGELLNLLKELRLLSDTAELSLE